MKDEAPLQDIPDLIAGALGVSRGTAYDLMREALKEASPVQPVAWRAKNFYEGQQSWFYADWHSDGLVPQNAELLYGQAQTDVRLISEITKNLIEISTAVSNKNEDDAQKILGKTLRLLSLDTTPPAQPAPTVQEPVALEAVYETIINWDEGGGKRSRRELARRIVDLYITSPAAPVQEPVALDITLEGDEAQALYDQLGDDREDLHPIRMVVGDGHSGHGLYVAQAEYQDEGAVLITSITPPAAKNQFVGLTDEDKLHIEIMGGKSDVLLAEMVETKLKERNA